METFLISEFEGEDNSVVYLITLSLNPHITFDSTKGIEIEGIGLFLPSKSKKSYYFSSSFKCIGKKSGKFVDL